jgi:hypothetical protein
MAGKGRGALSDPPLLRASGEELRAPIVRERAKATG